jgi:hypothetical protein
LLKNGVFLAMTSEIYGGQFRQSAKHKEKVTTNFSVQQLERGMAIQLQKAQFALEG